MEIFKSLFPLHVSVYMKLFECLRLFSVINIFFFSCSIIW